MRGVISRYFSEKRCSCGKFEEDHLLQKACIKWDKRVEEYEKNRSEA